MDGHVAGGRSLVDAALELASAPLDGSLGVVDVAAGPEPGAAVVSTSVRDSAGVVIVAAPVACDVAVLVAMLVAEDEGEVPSCVTVADGCG